MGYVILSSQEFMEHLQQSLETTYGRFHLDLL